MACEYRDYDTWARKRAAEKLAELMRELRDEAPDAAAEEVAIDAINGMEAAFSDDFAPLAKLFSKDIEFTDPRAEQRREHGTYFTRNGMRAA